MHMEQTTCAQRRSARQDGGYRSSNKLEETQGIFISLRGLSESKLGRKNVMAITAYTSFITSVLNTNMWRGCMFVTKCVIVEF